MKFTRAVFVLEFDNNVAGPQQDEYAIRKNPCWPEWILPDDPGYCLLLDDPWYTEKDEMDFALIHTKDYHDKPGKDLLEEADKRKKDAGGGSKTRRRRRRRELQIVDDGGLAVKEANITRRLSEEEMEREVEVVQCKDRTCAKERLELRDEEAVLIIEGEKIVEPNRAEAAVSDPPTIPTVEVGLRRREDILPRFPVATEVAG